MEKLVQGAKALNITLSSCQISQFNLYYSQLIEWNRRVNLTSITQYEEVQIKHFLDSLTLALVFRDLISSPSGSTRLLDVASGGGFPGIPLAIAFPDIILYLLESTAKKVRFLENALAVLGLESAQVLHGRAEELAHLPQYREQFPMVVSRALAKLPVALEMMLPFCTLGGLAVAMKKGDIQGELNQGERAAEALGGRLKRIEKVPIAEFGDDRALVVFEKVSPTDENYPRRPGIPSKRPLG